MVRTICVFRSSGGGGLDVMVLMSSYVACCFVNFELEVGMLYKVGDAGR